MEWISVEDRLPDVVAYASSDVLVCGIQMGEVLFIDNPYKGDYLTTVGWLNKNGKWDFVQSDRGNKLDPVTHWMPLPEPPNNFKVAQRKWTMDKPMNAEELFDNLPFAIAPDLKEGLLLRIKAHERQVRNEAFEALCFLCVDGGGTWATEPRREANGEWRHGLRVGNDLPPQPCKASELREKLMEADNE